MNSIDTRFKSILKYSLIAIALIVLLVIGWAAYINYHGDEVPDAGRDAFYARSSIKIPDNQNIAVAISGLNALEGKNTIEYGRFLTDASNNELTHEAARFFANGPAKLNIVGKREEFECWLDDELVKTATNCASPERLKDLLVANKTLLSRYVQLYSLPSWQGSTYGGGQSIIDLNMLLAAEIKLDIDEGRLDIAYQKWRNNFQFINRILATKSTMIERAIFLVADGLSLNSIEYLLLKSPEFNAKYYDELQVLLKPNDLKRYNLRGMLGADYEFVENQFIAKQQSMYYVHPNFILNRVYRMQMDFYNGAQNQPSNIDMASAKFAKQYQSQGIFKINWLDPFNSYLANKITGGLPSGFELIKSMHSHNATINALNLLTQIRVKNIESSNIQGFINQAGATFNNRFTEKPLQWNAEKKAIIFTNPLKQIDVEYKL